MLKTRNSLSLLRSNGLFANVKQRFQVTAAAAKESAIPEWEEARPFEEIPRESYFGLLRKMLPGGKFNGLDFGQMMLAMRKEYGEMFVLPAMLGRKPILTTHRPQDFERVFRHEGVWPHRPGSEALQYHREKYRPEFYQGVEGLISTNGKNWGNFRSIVNPVLMQPKNARLYYKKMSQVNQQFVTLMREIRDPVTNELPANFEDYINRWTLESVTIVALDKELGLLKDQHSNPQAVQLFKSLTEFFQYTADLEMKPSPWRYFPTKTFKKLMKALDSIQNVSLGYVNEAIERLEAESQKGIVRPENEQSVLEKLLKIDKKVATVMAMDMLMAGVDTTSSTFTAIMLCLAKHPDKQALLREEIMRILPDKNSEFTEETMKNVPYLRACIKEAHRIYPLVVGNARITERDCVLSGYRVPAGTFISMVTLTINQNEKYFQRPTEYLPERWIRAGTAAGKCPASSELKASNPFAYLPFGFGPRMCIGKRIVDMELELGIARIIRNFHVEFNHSTDNAFKTVLMNMPNIPLQFKLTDVA